MTEVTLRPGTPADADPCGRICYEAFRTIAERHGFPPDFPSPDVAIGVLGMILGRADVYAVVAETNGRVVGSNFFWEGSAITGVGPITVDPATQNAAIGRRLMAHGIARSSERGAAGIRLVQAAYHGRSLSLYAKLGFDVREPLAIMQGPPIGETIPGRRVRGALAADLAACDTLCRRVHGHDRSGEVREATLSGGATVVEHDGRITGYATLIGFFGHAVGETTDDLKALIAAAPEFVGTGFHLPTRNTDLFRWCLARGLRVVQPMTLMSLGLYAEPRGAFLPSIIY